MAQSKPGQRKACNKGTLIKITSESALNNFISDQHFKIKTFQLFLIAELQREKQFQPLIDVLFAQPQQMPNKSWLLLKSKSIFFRNFKSHGIDFD